MAEDGGRQRMSTSDAIALTVSRNFVLQEALRMRLVNFHSLARLIGPKVEELTGRKLKPATLVVSIKRFSDRMVEQRQTDLARILQESHVTLTGGMVELTVSLKDGHEADFLEALAEVTKALAAVPEMQLLPQVARMLTERDDGAKIKGELGSRYPIATEEGLAKVGVRLGKSASSQRGVATFITEILYRNGIVLRSAYVGLPEASFVVDERLGTTAYDIIVREVSPRA